jgi:1-pyrroline-5-carboxylate dehydrogenase
MDAITRIATPFNEPVLEYRPGSRERAAVRTALAALSSTTTALTCTIGGEQRMGRGQRGVVVRPHKHGTALGEYAAADSQNAQDAINAALAAAPAWQSMSYDDRAAIFLRAAELLSGPWRARLNAATMLGQDRSGTPAANSTSR